MTLPDSSSSAAAAEPLLPPGHPAVSPPKLRRAVGTSRCLPRASCFSLLPLKCTNTFKTRTISVRRRGNVTTSHPGAGKEVCMEGVQRGIGAEGLNIWPGQRHRHRQRGETDWMVGGGGQGRSWEPNERGHNSCRPDWGARLAERLDSVFG